MEAGPEDMSPILDETYRELGRSIRVPGFRSGKVPRKLIDSHLGIENVRMEAVKKGLPTLYLLGVQESGISPVSDPEIDILETRDDMTVIFEAKVDVKPEVVVSDYRGIEVERPDTSVTEEDVSRTLDEARDRFATLEVVEGKAVTPGDFVLFDYKVFTDGVPVEGSTGSDILLEVGSGDFLPDFDKQLEGARKGDILDVVVSYPPEYEVRELAGKPATYRTIVKEVKKKVLPPLDDDLAREVSSFETLEEFKEDLRVKIARIKEMGGERQVRDTVLAALVDRTYVDLPESMVEHQVEHEIDDFAAELASKSISLDDYLGAMKGTKHQLEKAIRERVSEGLKAELILQAVADAEEIEITDEEAEEYIRTSAAAAGGDPETVLEEMRLQMRVPVVKASMRVNRALDILAENAVFTGEPAVKTGEPEAAADGPEGEPAGAEQQPAAESGGLATADATGAESAPDENPAVEKEAETGAGEEPEKS